MVTLALQTMNPSRATASATLRGDCEFLHCQLDHSCRQFRKRTHWHALRTALPARHLRDESREVVKLGIGLVGTMAALVLGLLGASAKSSYDAQSTEMTQMSANIIFLDRVLAHYGPETQEELELLRKAVVGTLDR